MRLSIPKPILKFWGSWYVTNKPFFLLYSPTFHKIKDEQYEEFLSLIQPGDLLVRRSDGYYISNRGIEGFWKHAALVETNKTIIHAIGKGVVREGVHKFLRCDSVGIYRLKSSLTNKQLFIANAIGYAQQFVKAKVPYDYDYTKANEALYCTELLNECYLRMFLDYFTFVYKNTPFERRILLPVNMVKHPEIEKVKVFINSSGYKE